MSVLVSVLRIEGKREPLEGAIHPDAGDLPMSGTREIRNRIANALSSRSIARPRKEFQVTSALSKPTSFSSLT